MSRYLKEFKEIYSGFMERSHSLIVGGYWHLKANRLKFKNKADDFKHVQAATEAVVEALSLFIEGAEGEREKPGVQPYIGEVLKTINIHLERISKYYDKNKPSGFKKNENKKAEEIFQQQVFKGERNIKTALNKMNLDNTYDGVIVEFFDNRLATLPMKDILYDLDLKIKKKIDSLLVDWSLIMDNGFLINMKKSKIPEYNPDRHFWDQEQEVLQFWISEWNKIKYGITVDGYYIHGWLYFHLNYFKTPIGDEGDAILNPPLRDNEWYLHEIVKDAEEKARNMEDAGIFIFGTRRFAKSTGEASWGHYKAITNPSKNGTLTATNEKDILSITDKINISLEYMHPAFYVYMNSKDWTKQVKFGLKKKSGREYKLFYLDIINTDSGSKKGGQKTAGAAPVFFVMDEAGKESFLKSYNAAIPSFETSTGWKCIPWYVGTGGEEDLSQEAEKVLANPKEYRFIEADWDLLEDKIENKNYITWKRRKFGHFIPAQMGYKKGFKRIEREFSDFLGIESEELSKIKIQQTDWKTNTEVCLAAREKLKNNREQLQQEIVFYPLDPEECFMSAKNNPFPASTAKTHRERLIAEGNEYSGTGSPVELYRDPDDRQKILSRISNKEVATYPHTGGFIDSPVILFEPLPEIPPPLYMYIAGLDDYKHESSDGDSVGSITIYKRNLQLDDYCGTPVATLATRPDPHGDFHNQIHMLLDAFNAMCFPENEDMDIKKYFDRLGLSYKYLGTSFDVTRQLNFTNTGNRKYGWQPDKNTTPFVIGLVIDYCKEPIDIKDNDGNIVETRLGVERIKDIHLLEEIIKYKEDGNFDRIISFGSALFYDHYCNITYKFPRVQRNKKEEIDENDWWAHEKKRNKGRNKYFTSTRRKLL